MRERNIELTKSYVTALWWHEEGNFAIMLRDSTDGTWLVLIMCEARQTSFRGASSTPESEVLETMRTVFCGGVFPHHEILLQTDDPERIADAVLSVPFMTPVSNALGGVG